MQIANRVFVVTGAGNGIGREVALGLARRGGRVVGIDRSQESLRETADLVMAECGAGKFGSFTVDLTDRAHIAELPELIMKEFGQVGRHGGRADLRVPGHHPRRDVRGRHDR